MCEMDKKENLALLEACKNGDLNAAVSALEQGADIDAAGDYNDSPLNITANWGFSEIVNLLIDKGADLNHKGAADLTPLMNAATGGYFNIVSTLIAKGAVITNDLISVIQMKVNILKENSESGMVLPEAVTEWQSFLDYILQERTKQELPLIIKTLSDPSMDERKRAVDALKDAAWKGIDITPALIELQKILSESDHDLKYYASLALCVQYLRDSNTAGIEGLFNHDDDSIKEGAIYGIFSFAKAGMDISFSLPLLNRLLEDKNESVSHDAAISIGDLLLNIGIDVAPALPNLIKLLSNKDPSMRADIAWVFVKMFETGMDISSAVPSLKKLLSDEDDKVREMAAKALS